MARNFTMIFMGQKEGNGPWLHLGGAPRGHNPPGGARRPRRALVGCAHLGCPLDRFFALQIPKYFQNPRGVDEIFIQPLQSPEPPDPI